MKVVKFRQGVYLTSFWTIDIAGFEIFIEISN